MEKDTNILPVSEDVQWIGVLDKDIVTFDIVMHTQYGTTYNAYFINAQKKVLIESVKEEFTDVYLDKLRQVTDLDSIEYIVMNHNCIIPEHCGNYYR